MKRVLLAAPAALLAAGAAAQVAAVRPIVPSLGAPAFAAAAAPSFAAPSFAAPSFAAPALSAAPALALSPALAAPSLNASVLPAAVPAAAPALVAAPAAAPSAKDELTSGAARIGADAKSPESASGAFFDGTMFAAAADGPAVDPSADAISALNAAVAEVLRPYNNQVSRASLTFGRVDTNATRATAVSLSLDYAKKGPGGEASLKVGDLSYSYPDAASAVPQTTIKGSIGVNLRNLMTQEQINQLGPQLHQMAAQFVADKLRQYGAAATVDARVTRQEADAAGNLTAIGLELNLAVDPAKLPAGRDPKGVLVTGLKVAVDLTLNGLDFSATIVSNPDARQFERDQVGLKESLDKLLARDPKEVARLGDLVRTLDQLADYATKAPKAPRVAIKPESFPVDLGFPEPTQGLAAARAAVGPDAQLIAVGANFRNKSQTWAYTFLTPSTKEFVKIGVGFTGRAQEISRFPARDINPSAPIDLNAAISLTAAYTAARHAGFMPETVSLERDLHGRAQWRFEGLGDQQVIVDAVTGAVISPIR